MSRSAKRTTTSATLTAPAAARVEAFLARALAATGGDAPTTAGALVPWICDALLSNHSMKAYGRDLMDFLRHMQSQGVTPLEVTAWRGEPAAAGDPIRSATPEGERAYLNTEQEAAR